MATKTEERKALEQIRKIVEGLGKESYLGKAFEGVFEIAESNIDNDFMNSPKQAMANLRENLHTANAKIADLERDLDEAKVEAKAWMERFNEREYRINDLNNELAESVKAVGHHIHECNEQEHRANTLEQEVLKLKAKLYDYMTA